MALRWTAAAMLEATKGFRRLKAYKQLPKLRDALLALRAARAESRPCQSRRGRVGDGEQRLLICNTGRDISHGPSYVTPAVFRCPSVSKGCGLRLELTLKPLERRVDQRKKSDAEIESGVSTKISNSAARCRRSC